MRASRFAASYGARVAVAECDRFGGTCVNLGCIPKKLFSYAAHSREDFEVARSVGQSNFGSPTLEELVLEVYDDVHQRLHAVAMRSLAAHLGKLAAEGRVRATEGRYALVQSSA